MKKQVRTSALALALAGVMVVGAAAATVQKITADLRPDITVKVDGDKQTLVDKNGNIVYPVTYTGTTYLPVRALGNVIGMEVGWDSKTQTVSLTTPTATKPEDLTLEKLTTRTSDAEDEVKALKPAATYAERARQYALHSATIDVIRTDLNAYAQKVNDQLRNGDISYQDYNVTASKIDDLDRRLKDALADLEAKTIADESDKTTLFQEFTQALDELEARVKAEEKAVGDLKSAATAAKRMEQYNQLAPDLTQLRADITATGSKLNDYLRREQLSYSEYNTLSQRCNGLDVRMKAAWETLAEKTYLYEEEQSKPSGDNKTYDKYAQEIKTLTSKVEALENQSKGYGRDHGNKQGWKEVERKIDELDDAVDDLEDDIERSYRKGELTHAEYKELDKALDKLDDRLDDLEDWFDD